MHKLFNMVKVIVHSKIKCMSALFITLNVNKGQHLHIKMQHASIIHTTLIYLIF